VIALTAEAAEATMRERIRETVRQFPGIHLRGITKHVETSTTLARYHLDHLIADGSVRETRVGGFTRYFPRGADWKLSSEDRAMLNVLRQERPLEIVLALLEFGGLQHRDLVETVGGSKATLSYHLEKLVKAGIVEKVPRGERKGFHLVDPPRVRRLLSRYEPVPEIDQQVHDLWDDLFRGRAAKRGLEEDED
jgi:predicted transcriptional regulator